MATVLDINGKKTESVDLPIHFSEKYRPDLIRRAVLAIQSHRIQPHGTYKLAGMEHRVELSKRRKEFRSTYGRGQSRTPRKVMARQGGYFRWMGAFAPNTVGGRVAHTALAIKKFFEKINNKERRKAIRSAIAATAIKEIVLSRGHKVEKVEELPIIASDDLENMKKTKDIESFLKKINLEEELERTKEKKVRAGKGKRRGRKYKSKVGPLFVVSKKCELLKSARNIAGADVVQVKDLNAELLAPGTHPGRLVIWTKSAIEKLRNMFV